MTPPVAPDRYFRLDAVHADLSGRSARSGALAVSARGAQVLLQLGSFVVLARLLAPADFGVIAMVLPLTLLIHAIANLGLQTTVIQRESLDHEEASAVFWFAAGRNLLACAGMAFAAPLLARLYGEPRVIAVTLAWSAVLYLATLAAVHEALLKRQMKFGAVLSLQVAAVFAGTALAILAALLGARHWALLTQIAVTEAGRSGGMWIACRWRPAAPRRGGTTSPAVRALRAYWANLSGFRVLSWLGEHPDRVLVGSLGGAAVVGLYDSARRWAWYPFIELFLSLSDVAVSALSRVRADAARYRQAVRRAVTPLLAVSLPVIAFLFVEAGAIVLVVLGDRWLGAVPFVRLMCVAAFAGSLGRITQWLYLSLGETRRQLRWAMFVHTPIMLAAILTGSRWGAVGVATAWTAASAALVLPGVAYCLRVTPLSIPDFTRMVWRPVFVSVAAAAGLVTFGRMLAELPLATGLVVRVALFGLLYAALFVGLPGGIAATQELRALIGSLKVARTDRPPVAGIAAELSRIPPRVR